MESINQSLILPRPQLFYSLRIERERAAAIHHALLPSTLLEGISIVSFAEGNEVTERGWVSMGKGAVVVATTTSTLHLLPSPRS